MKYDPNVIKSTSVAPRWQEIVKKYQSPDARSIWQILNTVIPYIGMWYLMYMSLSVSYWLTLAMSPIAAGLMIRTFIIMHDCGHGSFFKSSRANHIVGTITGILTHTPYFQWTREHAIHHATSGDLSRRGTGDVSTMTVNEYKALTPFGKLKYRAYRHPITLLLIGPHYIFLFWHRFVSRHSKRRERNNVYLTNVALAVLYGSLWYAVGLKALLMVSGPIVLISGFAGVWLFYIQHQYEDTYWRSGEEWEYGQSALLGSSYYKLPRILQWFSGNIGFHHIHHLSPKIPNYKLEQVHRENPLFQESTTIRFFESWKALNLKLWDEETQKMVGFKQVH